MHYVKDIFEKKQTEHAHDKFIRYSKGVFPGPAIKLKVMKKGIKIHSSFHINDEILNLMASYLKDKEIHVKGVLAWNKDLNPELEENGIKYSKVKKARGIFKYVLDNQIQLSNFMKHMGKYNLLLSFKEEDVTLTTKNVFPKPNKEINKNFCKAMFPLKYTKKIMGEFAFDIKGAEKLKEIEIEHEIIIKEIHLPENEPFEIARRLAKREGILKRIIHIKGQDEPIISEMEFKV